VLTLRTNSDEFNSALQNLPAIHISGFFCCLLGMDPHKIIHARTSHTPNVIVLAQIPIKPSLFSEYLQFPDGSHLGKQF
jgi:hypothetical protein